MSELRASHRMPVGRTEPSTNVVATSSVRWVVRLGCVPAGALVVLAFPAANLWWLALVGLVPAMVLVCRAASRREAGWRAWCAGIGFFAAAYYWLLPSVGPAFVALVALFALTWLPWGLIAWSLLSGSPSAGARAVAVALVPAAWVAADYLRSAPQLGGPWALLGAAVWQTRLVAVASLGGVWLVSFVLVAINTTLAIGALSIHASPRAALVPVAGAMVLTGALHAYGSLSPTIAPTGRLRIAGVQPGWIDDTEARFTSNEQLTRSSGVDGADLIVWGESSVGYDLDTDAAHLARLEQLAREKRAQLLVNVDARRADGTIAKTSMLIGPSGIEGRYDKQRLVPFGEYVPLRDLFGWTSRVSRAASEDRRAGGGEVLFTTASGARVGPLICFESTFPDLSRDLARDGADVVVVQSATTTFQGTWAQPQHASLASVRARETGRPVVHAAVSGVSTIVDGTGQPLVSMGSDVTGVYVADVSYDDRRTASTTVGDVVPAGAIALVLVTFLVALIRAATKGRPDREGLRSGAVGGA